jgi:adenosine deaminase
MAKPLPIAVGLIAIIQRILPVEVGARVTDFAIENKDSFVALDLADNEVGFDAKPFAPHFHRAKKAGLHITVHSGESNVPGAHDFVRGAIENLGAERIGHGVQIYKSKETMDFVKARGVPLELCPTSNWLTNAVSSTAAHPFRQLMEYGVPVTINSDDPGVFDLDLTNEYRVLATEHGFTRAEFDRCNDTAAAASFISLKEKQKVWPRPITQS